MLFQDPCFTVIFFLDFDPYISFPSASVCEALTWDENHRKSVAHKSSEVQVKGGKGGDGVEGGGKVYLYIVMQLCQRESLKSWLRSTSASQQRTRNVSLKIFKEICSGVEYVHYQGLIHRDLKPENIFKHLQKIGKHRTSSSEELRTNQR